MHPTYKKYALSIFGKTADKYLKNFESLGPNLKHANVGVLLRTWVAIIFLTALIVFVSTLAVSIAVSIIFQLDIFTAFYVILLIPILTGALAFMMFYAYPIQKAKKIRKSIDLNMPFALTHMSAIASSGIPPELMFELITKFEEYGEVSKQAALIVRNIKTFGMSSVAAIKDVAQNTPSFSFKQVLSGIDSTIEKGGNLTQYLEEMSDKALFDYKMEREKYMRTLSAYADVYTALLIAAPLMMLAILGILSVIGGTVGNLGIAELMYLITLVIIPVLNIGFIIFVHVTYPGV